MLGQLLYPDEMPKKLVILGVEASDVDSFNAGLLPKVEQSIPEIIGTIKEELGQPSPYQFPRTRLFSEKSLILKNG